MDRLRQDLRHALRTLARSPGFTAVVLLTLALGIGANSAIFSVVDGVLLRPLPYERPEELVRVFHRSPERGVERGSFSPPDFEDLERAVSAESAGSADSGEPPAAAFSALARYWFVPGLSGMNLAAGGPEGGQDDQPLRLDVAYVSGDLFETLGVPAAAGRTIRPEEDREGEDRVAVLSDGLWRRRFGADPGVVGQTIVLAGRSFTVLGVMPAGFRFPSPEADLWAPLSLIGEDSIPTHRSLRWQDVVARLAPGVGVREAEAAADTALARLAGEYPDTNATWTGAGLVDLRETVVGQVRAPLATLLAAVALVLLIACANLANLLLARMAGREREMAVRAALGAGRRHLVRPLLAEAAVLAAGGGLLGLLVARYGLDLLLTAAADAVPRAGSVAIDGRVVLFTLAVSLATGLLFALLPALRVAATRGARLLHAAPGAGGGGQRLRAALVVAETALAVALLIGAGLLLRSYRELSRVDPGFRTADVLTFSFTADGDRFDDRSERSAYQRRVLERVGAVPGVISVGGAKTVPLRGGGEPFRFGVPGRGEELVEPEVGAFIVTGGYFRTLGIPLRSGRIFDERAVAEGRPEIVVSESFARQVWGRDDVVGETLLAGEGAEVPVVGVVGDVRTEELAAEPGSAVYVPAAMAPRSTMKVFARTAAADPLTLAGSVRQAVRRVDPDQPISELTTLRAVAAEQTARPRLLTTLLGLFAGLAVTLAAIGLYGVISFAVGRRTREIGVRMALGASRWRVLAGVIARAGALTAAGLALGLCLAWTAAWTEVWSGGHLLASQLYGIRPTDLPAFAGAVLVLALVSLLAALLPARRATRVDPVEALRAE
ncbi:MAG: ABC transporter permease [Acidobacteriota bacterium]|jgi:predicted permease